MSNLLVSDLSVNHMTRLFKSSAMLTEAFGALAVRGLGIVLTFAFTTLMARVLGPAEYGTYITALATATLMATLAPLGTDRILVRKLSVAKNGDQQSDEIALTHVCAGTVVGLVVACMSLLGISACLLFPESKWGPASLLSCVLFVPLTLTYLRQWAAIPLVGTRAAVIPEQTVLPLITMLIIGSAYAAGIRFYAVSTTLLFAGVMATVWWFSLKNSTIQPAYQSAWLKRKAFPSASIRERISEGVPFISVAIGAVLTQSCMPLIIAAGCGFTAAGYFALAAPYAALAAIPLGVFNMSMLARCSQHFERGEVAEANHAVRSAATVTFVLATLISAVIWMATPWLTVILGHDYAPVQTVLPALLLAAIVDSLTGPTIPVMQTMTMERTHARSMMVFIPIQLLLIYSFSSIMELEGAALGYLAARCLWNIIVVTEIYRQRNLLMLPYANILRAVSEKIPETLASKRPVAAVADSRSAINPDGVYRAA